MPVPFILEPKLGRCRGLHASRGRADITWAALRGSIPQPCAERQSFTSKGNRSSVYRGARRTGLGRRFQDGLELRVREERTTAPR
jgi:hypothetical protein